MIKSPSGSMDMIPEEVFCRSTIENKIKAFWEKNGFVRVSTPIIEHWDKLQVALGDNLVDKTIRFIDRFGEVSVLSPDLTVSIARMVSARKKNGPFPLKYFYLGDVFRVTSEQSEIRQCGVEIIGADKKSIADVELAVLIFMTLRELGINNIYLEIGNFEILRDLLKLEILDDYRQSLIDALLKKDWVSLNAIANKVSDSKISEFIKNLPKLTGTPEEVFSNINLIPDFLIPGVKNLENISKEIKNAGVKHYINLALVNEISYYTGFIFQVFVTGSSKSIGGGGRYDDLYSLFNFKCPSSGFGINVDKIYELLKASYFKTINTDVLLCFNDGIPLHWIWTMAASYRDQGIIVEIDLKSRNFDEAIEFSKNKKAQRMVYILKLESSGISGWIFDTHNGNKERMTFC
jgi:ATP phosphoribosyltransferase regulatory subunit